MMNDPLTHLHLHRLNVDQAAARRQHRLDRPPGGRHQLRRLWAALRSRRGQVTTAPPARSITAAADVGTDVDSCIGTTRSAPHAA